MTPEFWGEVQPPASLKGLDIPSRRAVFVPGNRAEGRRSEWETRLFVEEPMLSTGLHFASESTAPPLTPNHQRRRHAEVVLRFFPFPVSKPDARVGAMP